MEGFCAFQLYFELSQKVFLSYIWVSLKTNFYLQSISLKNFHNNYFFSHRFIHSVKTFHHKLINLKAGMNILYILWAVNHISRFGFFKSIKTETMNRRGTEKLLWHKLDRICVNNAHAKYGICRKKWPTIMTLDSIIFKTAVKHCRYNVKIYNI